MCNSFLKHGRPRTYLLRLSVCLSCLKPKEFGGLKTKFDDDAGAAIGAGAPG